MSQHTDKVIAFNKIMGKRLCPLCDNFFKNKGFTEHKHHCEKRNGDWTSHDIIKGPYLCKFCKYEWPSRDARNGHQIKCKLNPEREKCIANISKSCIGRKMSEETKTKISVSMKKYKDICKKLGSVVGKTQIKNTEGEMLDFFFKDEL